MSSKEVSVRKSIAVLICDGQNTFADNLFSRIFERLSDEYSFKRTYLSQIDILNPTLALRDKNFDLVLGTVHSTDKMMRVLHCSRRDSRSKFLVYSPVGSLHLPFEQFASAEGGYQKIRWFLSD